jgi:MOSC domain-containing protein YiiM
VIAKLVSIQIGTPQTHSDQQGEWQTAFFKDPVTGPIFLGELGLAGDQVFNTEVHGGREQAVLMYCADHYALWGAELGQALPYGGFAENLTVSDLAEDSVRIGDIYQIGWVKIQVTRPRIPCAKISRRWGIPDLTKRVSQTGRTGWMCQVNEVGEVEAGMMVELVDRKENAMTVAEAYQAYLAT